MAQNFIMNVGENFNVTEFSQRLADVYRAKGFSVNVANIDDGTSVVVFDKDTGGINMLLGLGLGVKGTCTCTNGNLIINYTEEEWTGKIIGLAVGWILCWIPFVTALIGVAQQSSLTKNINNDAMMVISAMRNGRPGAPYNGQPQYGQPNQQPYQQPNQQQYQQPPQN